MERFFAGTRGDAAKEIFGLGKSRFGGIFASASEDVARSHGAVMQIIESPRHVSAEAFDHEVLFGGTEGAYELACETIRKLSGIEIDPEDWVDAIIEDRGGDLIESFGADVVCQVTNEDSAGEADWVLQAWKGLIARKLGYTSVGMRDEHGESVLCLPGCTII